MNCSQARAMLAIYRENKQHQVDTTALAVHLAHCTACKELDTQYRFIGESIRTLPPIEPAPDAHQKLMRALAAEHVRFFQHAPSSTASTPTPTFLAPYLKELAQKAPLTDTLAAFSTADTGPLPIVNITKRRPATRQTRNNFAIVGLAAAVLMVLMVGGLTSLLVLANQGSSHLLTPITIGNSGANLNFSQVAHRDYSAPATYPHVASALAEGKYIYYTTYNDSGSSWMIEQYDSKANSHTPLLAIASGSPLLLIGSSKDWLIWLQLDPPGTTEIRHLHPDAENTLTRTWSIHSKFLGNPAIPPTPGTNTSADTLLYNDTFNPNNVPSWVHTPLQGAWLTQSFLLLAIIDAKGNSHIWDYQLDTNKGEISRVPTELASANNGHILTSPTANSDDTNIYWSDEWWQSSENKLKSNIWTQQIVEAIPARQGRWAAHMHTDKYAFRSDEKSFHPQIVNDMLFFLSTNPVDAQKNSDASATPDASIHSTATPQPGTPVAVPSQIVASDMFGGAVRIDPTIYTAQVDAKVQGKLQAYSANGSLLLSTPFDNETISSPQGGSRFLIWQNKSGEFEMYDAVAKAPVTVGMVIPKNATFLAVNGDTAVWIVNTDTTTDQGNPAGPTIHFGTIEWPIPLKDSSGS